jgi:EpsI family protein
VGPAAAEGFFHDFSGWLIFMSSMALLLAFGWLLKRIAPEGDIGPSLRPGDEDPEADHRAYRVAGPGIRLAVPVVLVGLSVVLAQQIKFREKVPMKQAFTSFPERVAEWRGVRREMEKVYLDELLPTDYVLMDYSDGRGGLINLYSVYYASQSKGDSTHSPDNCLPGDGWIFEDSGRVNVAIDAGRSVDVNRAVIEKSGRRQVVYYWFLQRGRVLHYISELKVYAFWDALTMKRTDGALVRVSVPVSERESVAEADSRLRRFIGEIVPVLDRFIPGRDV